MLPLKDTVRARDFPIVTAVLIGINLLVFVFELSLPPRALEIFFWTFGVVPERLVFNPSPWDGLTLITSQFLHGGWLHLGSNLLALYIFGDNVEDRLGRSRFLGFYLVSGVIAGLVHVWAGPTSPVPSLGASGAISGVLAAYVVMFPTSRIVTLIPIFIIPWFVEVPALLWVASWFISQLLNGLLVLGADSEPLGGVAWWAHIGGFVAGLLLVWPLRRPEPKFHSADYWPW
jgi:membrane associated rhomboid family serine protease